MRSEEYEMVVVGGGPAGLSAARSAARLGFRTLLLERLPRPGDLSHPSSGVIAPVPGLISHERSQEGLYFPQLDLLLPPSLVLRAPVPQTHTTPGGSNFAAGADGDGALPVGVIDPSALLCLLAEQADHAGAALRYGTSVTGLLQEGRRIAGVRTTRGTVRADVVLSGEGSARRLCEEAQLYGQSPVGRRFAYVVSQQLDAPAVSAEDLGQIVTSGRQYTSAPDGFGTVVLPVAGRAIVYFTIFAERAKNITLQSCWDYLDQYMTSDPRVHDLFRDARILSRAGYRTVLREAPQRLVRDGFMGLGDAVMPGAPMGILPAIYSGRQAALVAAGAIDSGDTSAAGLAGYGTLFHGSVLQSMQAESKLMLSLTGIGDDELNRLGQAMQTMPLNTPYFSSSRSIAWDTIAWLFRHFAPVAGKWDLLPQVLTDVEKAEDQDELLPIPFASVASGQLRPLAHADVVSAMPLRFRVLA